ncbi:MAG: flippase-like domain-containing protein [Syntrophaceae bacterium]|nr:flippase-like domain-containing protein [Syntrophaceae bacterium]
MLRFVLTWLITIAIFIVLFSRISFIEVFELIKQTNIYLFVAAILFSILTHVFLSSARLKKVVEIIGCRLSFFESVIIRMGCNPIKGVLPFKTGELTILAYMNKKHNLSYSKGFVSLLLGYVFSFIALILFYSFGGIFYFHSRAQRIFFVFLFLLNLLFVITVSLRKIPLLISGFLKRIQKLPEEIKSLVEKYNSPAIKITFFYSLGIEGSKLLIIFLVLKSLRIDIPADALLLFGSATIIAAYLPVTYWGLGIREATILFLFSSYAPLDKLLAGSLLITFVDGLLPVLLGLFFMKPFLNSLWGNTERGIVSGDL